MKKRIASLLITLALCGGLTVPAAADQEFALQGQYTSGAYTYSLLDDGTAMIVEFNKNYSTYTELETLTIPAPLDGYLPHRGQNRYHSRGCKVHQQRCIQYKKCGHHLASVTHDARIHWRKCVQRLAGATDIGYTGKRDIYR